MQVRKPTAREAIQRLRAADTGQRGAMCQGQVLGAGLESHPDDEAETGHCSVVPFSLTTKTNSSSRFHQLLQHLSALACCGHSLHHPPPSYLSSPWVLPDTPTCTHTSSTNKGFICSQSDIPIPPHGTHIPPPYPLPTLFHTTPFKSPPA